MTAVFLVIDGGKSKTAATVVDGAGRVRASATGPGLPIISEQGGRHALERSLRVTLGLLGAGAHAFDTAVFGLNGVHAPSVDAEEAGSVLRDLVRVRRTAVTSDGVLSYVGALGSEPGVAVTAGTGAVLLAIGQDGRAHRVDGDGPLLGDRGSGYAIGLAGLRSAMRVLDGLDGSKQLAADLQRKYGSRDNAVRTIHASSEGTRLIASFSRSVAAAAERGDSVATEIWRDAGVDLAQGAAAAAARAGLAERPHRVAWSGGLFGVGELLHRPLSNELARIAPDARLQPAHGDALSGGAVLARSEVPVMSHIISWLPGAA